MACLGAGGRLSQHIVAGLLTLPDEIISSNGISAPELLEALGIENKG
jgi:hypothetical protein